MDFENKMEIKFNAKSINESFARVVVSAFVAQLNPTISEITEVKTAVSEAVTNSIIHGYDNDESKEIILICKIIGYEIEIIIKDFGNGIENIEKAREALYTTKPDMERSGMGFTIMEEFMDEIYIESELEKGTSITLKKIFRRS